MATNANIPSGTILREQVIPPKEYLGLELRKGQVLRNHRRGRKAGPRRCLL